LAADFWPHSPWTNARRESLGAQVRTTFNRVSLLSIRRFLEARQLAAAAQTKLSFIGFVLLLFGCELIEVMTSLPGWTWRTSTAGTERPPPGVHHVCGKISVAGACQKMRNCPLPRSECSKTRMGVYAMSQVTRH